MIYTIFTGGTIGSKLQTDGVVSTDSAQGFKLIELYSKVSDTEENFKTVEPYSILSENLEAKHIIKLIEQVRIGLSQPDTDGIIITHGTDTLQFTGAVLSYIFADSSVPIILVSSNFILSDKRSNGLANFYFAVRFIKEKRGNGVFISYFNFGGYPIFHRGNRLQNPIPFSDNVFSVRNGYYGRYLCKDNEISSWSSAAYESNAVYSVDPSNDNSLFNDRDINLSNNTGYIIRINPYVGLKYPEIPNGTKAIILESFHSGTIGITNALKDFLKKAKDKAVPVFLVGLSTNATKYETIKEYEKQSIIPLYDCAPISQYCKLWLLASNEMPIVENMKKSCCEEK